jgi:all-trans-retinol 13,14-reductase
MTMGGNHRTKSIRSCVIVGSGIGGLALGALLSRAGVTVTVLEAHPKCYGGYARTIRVGEYSFPAGPRYLWSFGEGEIGFRFLRRCGLEQSVPLVELDRSGFDHIYLSEDLEPICVPNGWNDFLGVLQARFPQDAGGLERFFKLCEQTFELVEYANAHGLHHHSWAKMTVQHILPLRFSPAKASRFLRRSNWTLQRAFDLCGLSEDVQAVLNAHGQIFAEPRETLSFHAYAGATLLYHRSCHYPKMGMDSLVQGLVGTIETNGGRLHKGTPVVAAHVGSSHAVEWVADEQGERYEADVFVANIDPRTFLTMLDGVERNRLLSRIPRYEQSNSITSLFLGVKDADCLRPALGPWNLWYARTAKPGESMYIPDLRSQPSALYLNSPTLLTGWSGDSPAGGATVTAFAPGGFSNFDGVESVAEYESLVGAHTEAVLDTIESRFVSDLRKHIDVVHVVTALDNHRLLRAPQGAIYGKSLKCRDAMTRIPSHGVAPNLHFVGHYPSLAGIPSVLWSACLTYQRLTGDSV